MAPNQDERSASIAERVCFTQMICPGNGKLYIFGYGSLIWRPNISYTRSWSGYIKGYKIRFYQGTTTHRGTPQYPGRVVTLLPSKNKEARVWGKAYEVDGAEQINAAIEHLAEREMILGGYKFDEVSFFPQRVIHENPEGQQNESQLPDVIRAFVYIAEPGNDQYLGKAPLEVQAHQIATAVGHCGRNVEYLQKLVDFINSEVPKNDIRNDQYILNLWRLVKEYSHNAESHNDDKVSIEFIDLTPANSVSSF